MYFIQMVLKLKGGVYFEQYYFSNYSKFVDECLSLDRKIQMFLWRIRRNNTNTEYREEYNFKEKVTKGFGSLINSCRHDVVVKKYQ